MNHINEQHTGGTKLQTLRIVKFLQRLGWAVDYGPSSRWQFETKGERTDFEYDLSIAISGC